MYRIKQIIAITAICISAGTATTDAQTSYRDDFLCPKDEHRSLIIWQWMDGLVTKDGITKDLEAFKSAGLSGVQNFQIGGSRQSRIGDPTCAIGSDKWKEMMRWAMEECDRLGLSFGTHNCPGWSSSAYGNVTPEYSMQKLVYSERRLTAEELGIVSKTASKRRAAATGRAKSGKALMTIKLARPDIDPKYNYYEDIAVLAVPEDSTMSKDDIIDMTRWMDADGRLTIPTDMAQTMMTHPVILRFGHTTNGRTNSSQSPVSGLGLECDKLRREAVKHFWDGYPQMVIDAAGNMAGRSFTRIEIDSYEAGGQDWSVVLPGEFSRRKGYDLMPYLPCIVGRAVIDDKEKTAQFKKDFTDVLTSLFAENYYGYMAELTAAVPGMQLLIEPYGTGRQKPFRVLDIYKILKYAPDALVATEFWVKPNWGWKDMAGHEKVMRNLQRPILYAEAFTCWPMHPWQDDPQSLKPICDRAYSTGVNRMMLHAGAANPWEDVEPGMSFGIWGTQFVPGQTWWKAGGARALFDYMARCQSLLQRGVPAKEQLTGMKTLKTYRRTDGGNDIIFVCNPTDKVATDTLHIGSLMAGKATELWNPYSLDMTAMAAADTVMTIEPNGSRFVVITAEPLSKDFGKAEEVNDMGNLLPLCDDNRPAATTIPIANGWTLRLPELACGRDTVCSADTLSDWTTSSFDGLKYFSGTATYTNTVTLKRKQLKDSKAVLDLGTVKNMAAVRINGRAFPVMWKAPFLLDVTAALRPGKNEIEIDVTNLWPNRMIGDEQEPDDIEWSEPLVYEYAPGSPVAGRYMASIPDWLKNGTPRPSKGRKTVCSFKFFTADSPLLSSGLLGPVTLQLYKQ